MELDGLKADLRGIADDVKRRVRDARERGASAGVQGLVEDMQRRVKAVIDRVTGRRDEEAPRVGETIQAADQRAARESGKTDVARAGAAKQAAKQRAKKA
jgi:hypothetical protein